MLILAVNVHRHTVAKNLEAMLFRNGFLAIFNQLVDEFRNFSALNAHHVIVMPTLIQLVNRAAMFKVMFDDQPCFSKLHQRSIHRGDTDFISVLLQFEKNIMGTGVFLFCLVQHFQNFHARTSDSRHAPAHFRNDEPASRVSNFHGWRQEWPSLTKALFGNSVKFECSTNAIPAW